MPTETPWAALPVLLAGAFMVVLDFFIVNVALPSIAADLGAGESSLEWIVAGYGLTFAAFLITAGRLGDLARPSPRLRDRARAVRGHEPLCGLAPSPDDARARPDRAGRGGRGRDAAGALDHRRHVPRRGLRPRAGIYGVVLGLAAVGGQVIGGALVEGDLLGLGWRWCFLINVPVGIAALAMTPRLCPSPAPSSAAAST